jgi:hypothetical protein
MNVDGENRPVCHGWLAQPCEAKTPLGRWNRVVDPTAS